MKNLYQFIFLFVLINMSFSSYGKNTNTLISLAPPTAEISGTTTVCQNAAQPQITFTGSGGTPQYKFTYTINGLNETTTPFSTANVFIVAQSTVTSGTFTYHLISVTDNANVVQPITVPDVVITVNTPPIVDFTFTNDSSCSGTPIQFSSSVIGTGTATYSWNFGDGNISTQQNPSHTFNELGCGTSIITVKLTVIDGGCTVSKTKTINIKQIPDINFSDLNNPFAAEPFNNCQNASASNPSFNIKVGNTSASSNCMTSYSINWGDGMVQNSIAFPISHNYTLLGVYNMVITATGTNGCSNSKTYTVKNVSNPLGGLNSPGSTQNLCAPTSNLQFSISNWGTNSLDTTYKINYGDGTPIIILTQNQLISSIYFDSTNPSTSANYPIPHIFTSSSCPLTSFIVKLDVTNACGTTPFTLGNISILTKPTANFTAPMNGCINSNVLFTNSTVSGYGQNCVQGSIYTWDFGDGSPLITTPISSPQNINHTYTNSGTYTVTLTAQNGCGTTTKTQQICIEPPLTPQFTLNNISGCTPLAVTTSNNTLTTNSCAPPTYVWSVVFVPSTCGTTITVIPNQTTTNASYNFTEPGTYSIKLTATNSCGSFSNTQTVTVKKPPTITSINGIATNYCGPSTINPTATVINCGSQALTYAWSFPGGTPATSTLPVPGAISYTTVGAFTVSLSVTNECGTTVATNKSFTIDTLPTITGNLFSCVGFTSQLTGSATAASTNPWTSSNSAVATVNLTGLVTGVSGGTSTITYTNSNNCKTTASFTVNPSPTITQPASSTVCLGGTPTDLSVTISGATGTPNYQWYSNLLNNTTTGTAIIGATNSTYSPPATTEGTLYYYCIITLSSGGCSNIKTNTATVIIIANPTITVQPIATQNLCIGVTTPSPLTVSYSGGTGSASYQWYMNTTNSNTSGTLIAGATSSVYTPPAFSIEGNYYYYATVSLIGNGCLPATSNVAEIVVIADPIINLQPTASQTLCQNATPINLEVIVAGGNGTFSYQWYSNSINANTGGILISGATNSSFTPLTNIVGTKYYYCIVSQPTVGCGVTSSTAAIIVISAPTITQPVSSTVCLGGTPTVLSITVSGATGTPQYQWYSNTLNNTTNGIAIVGETNPTYSPSTSSVGTIYYYCIIILPSGGCSTITSNTAAVTINAGATIVIQPTVTQSLCVGTTIATPLTVTYTGGLGTASYQWYSNSSNSNTGGTPISGATNASYTPPNYSTSGNFYYYVTLSFSGNGCGPITSNTAEILIINDPTINSQPTPTQTLCQGATPNNLTITVTGGIGNFLYQWFSNISNSNTGGILITGETNNTYTPLTTLTGKTYYYCEIKQSGLGCNVTSSTAEVIVNIAPTIIVQPQSSTICLGDTPTLLSVSYINGVGVPTYQWYSNTTNSTTGSSPITGATNSTFAPQNTTVGNIYYYCIITLPTGGCTSLTSNIAAVSINPNPVISNKSTIICSGNSFTFSPINSGSEIVPVGTTYTWSNPIISPAGSVTGASAQNNPQSEISQTLINTTTSPATVTYTVTPLNGVCIGANFSIVVTVNPAISANVTSKNSTCFGLNNGGIQTNITGGIPFSSGTPYIISWTGPNGFTSNQANISNLEPGKYILTITDAGGCPINETYTITEPNDLVITTDLEKDVSCFSAANGEIKITVTGGTLNYTYAWTKNGIPYANTEDILNLSLGTYQITVSDANNCGPKTVSFTITEPPILSVTLINKTDLLCFGESTGAINVNVVGGTAPYTFVWSGPNGFTSSIQNISNIVAGTYNLIVTDNLGCTKNLRTTLTQPNEIIIKAATTTITCYGDNNASITLTITGGVTPYTILWSNLGTGTFQDNLSAGDYLVTVTDANNCTKSLNINIPEAPLFTVNPVVKNISCYGANDGSIMLNFVGGVPPINLTWSDGSNSGTTRNNLKPGIYSVTIIDATPCTIFTTFTILEPQLLVLSANLVNALDCDNVNSGAINLLVSGGSSPYTYFWSNGAITEDLVNIPAGNYLVTVKDKNGCIKQEQFSIKRPPPIVTAVETKTEFNCDTKYVKQTFIAKVSGGMPPYNLVWSSGTVSGANNEIMNTNQNGTVILYVTDAIGCKSNYTFTVDIPVLGEPSFSVNSYSYMNFGNYSINDPIQFTNTSTGDFISMIWDFGDGISSVELNTEHTYTNPKDYVITQTVTYPLGCINVYKINLSVEKGYILVVPNAFTPNNDNHNETFRPVTKGLKNIRLDIYDTLGSMIFSETGDTLRGWDGKINGVEVENGNYYCKVNGTTFYGTTVKDNHPFVLIK